MHFILPQCLSLIHFLEKGFSKNDTLVNVDNTSKLKWKADY